MASYPARSEEARPCGSWQFTQLSAPALAITLREREPDRLETGQHRIAAANLVGAGSIGMTMAGATELQEFWCGPAAVAQRQRKFGLRSPAAGRFDVGPSRAVTPFAGDVGDHRLLLDTRTALCGDLGRVTAETGASVAGGRHAPVTRQSGRRWLDVMAGSEAKSARVGVIAQPMLQDRRDVRADHTHECRRMTTRPERVIGNALLDLALRLPRNPERPVMESIAPDDARHLGIGHGRPIQLLHSASRPAGRKVEE